MLVGLIGLNHAWPPPKEQRVQVTRDHPHHNATKSNDLLVCRHFLHQTKVRPHLMLNPPHLHRPLQTVSAILAHRQWMKESLEANTTNADMPILRTRKKGHQKFMTTNMADITMNGKDTTYPESYPEPHYHPALALRMTPLTTRAHIMPII